MDRELLLNILIHAKDETARAFAAATGNMEAYNARLKEQEAAAKASRAAQRDHAQELERGVSTTDRATSAVRDLDIEYEKHDKHLKKVLSAQQNLEESTRRYVQVQREGKEGTAEYARAVLDVETKQESYSRALKKVTGDTKENRRERAASTQQEFEHQSRLKDSIQIESALARQRERDFGEYKRLLNDVQNAERQRKQTVDDLQKSGVSPAEHQKITQIVDVRLEAATARLAAFRESERARPIIEHIKLEEDKVRDDVLLAEMRAKAHAAQSGGGGSLRSGGAKPDTNKLQEFSGWLKKNDEDAKNVGRTIGKVFGTAAIGLMQPLIGAVVGLAGSLVALGSAAIAAGGALGALFATAMAQGAPVMGLVVLAAVRLRSIFQLVSLDAQKQQQTFMAHYQAAHQAKQGINQVAEAQLGLQNALRGVTQAQWAHDDALFQQGRGLQDVQIATRNLTLARRDAARQLQDLVLQEKAAKLAAEGASISVVEAQRALDAAVIGGGDVRSAQLALKQAQLGHQQAQVGAVRAHQDASQAIQRGVEGSQQVIDAQRSMVDAQRAVIQNQRQVAQAQIGIQQANHQVTLARAQISQAHEAARGYNVQQAAQAAWLRSQMTKTELALANSVKRISGLFRGVHSQFRLLSDQILGAFTPITNRLYTVLKDPKVFGAALDLSKSVGNAIKRVGLSLLSPDAVKGMTQIMHDASKNMKPIADIAISFFHAVGNMIQIAGKPLHDFLDWLAQGAGKFAAWTDTAKGKNYLKTFFKDAFDSLKAFLGLGGSIIRLVADVLSIGGGAQKGIGVIDQIKGHIDGMSKSIEGKGKVWQDLQTIWKLIQPTLDTIGKVIDSVVGAIIRIAGSKDTIQDIKDLGNIITKIIVPAFEKFVHFIGGVVHALEGFFANHPKLQAAAVDLLGIGGGMMVLLSGVKLLFRAVRSNTRTIG